MAETREDQQIKIIRDQIAHLQNNPSTTVFAAEVLGIILELIETGVEHSGQIRNLTRRVEDLEARLSARGGVP